MPFQKLFQENIGMFLFFLFFFVSTKEKNQPTQVPTVQNSEAEDNHNRIARQMVGEAA